MPQAQKPAGRGPGEGEDERLRRIAKEIDGRADALHERKAGLMLEVETFRVAFRRGIHSEEELAALESYAERRMQADEEIQSAYSDPSHPYWRCRCAESGTGSFNMRILCERGVLPGVIDSYTGWDGTKYKSHMIDSFDKYEEPGRLVEKARGIGHPFEVVHVREEREDLVENLKAAGVPGAGIVVWMNPINTDPPAEERKDELRRLSGVNALSSDDLRALRRPPGGADAGLADSLSGFDMWMDLVRAGKLVKIRYKEGLYEPPYRLVPVK